MIESSIEPLRPILHAGLQWMFDTEQPSTAIIQHHGISRTCPNGRQLRFCPVGWEGHPVVVLDVSHAECSTTGVDSRDPLAAGELELLGEAIELSGTSKVISTWNGHPFVTGSIALARPAHPTLRSAVSRYLRGCPKHDTVFCSRGGCNWYRDGRKLVNDSVITEMSTTAVGRPDQ